MNVAGYKHFSCTRSTINARIQANCEVTQASDPKVASATATQPLLQRIAFLRSDLRLPHKATNTAF